MTQKHRLQTDVIWGSEMSDGGYFNIAISWIIANGCLALIAKVSKGHTGYNFSSLKFMAIVCISKPCAHSFMSQTTQFNFFGAVQTLKCNAVESCWGGINVSWLIYISQFYVLLTVHPRTVSEIIQLGAQFCLTLWRRIFFLIFSTHCI